MDTPICDFVRQYAEGNGLRLHMPGHKGHAFLGMEPLDITEIQGADSLYEADGIIARSEENASKLFGCRTFYSAEGSSQCIRAMLYLLRLYALQAGKQPLIAAGRNAHKSFLTAVGLLDLQVDWFYPEKNPNYLSCDLTPGELERYLERACPMPTAVYLTSPDYLGQVADIQALAAVCHRHGVLLAVDNAHGAYLKFLPESRHPMDLGADLCCDSAHKTLPVLTGGAYLHLAGQLDSTQARNALMLFGSTSPSYLILQSLDAANLYLQEYPKKLEALLPQVEKLKTRLCREGYALYGNEPLKLTLAPKSYGYTGQQLAQLLRQAGIEPEFADPDHVVLLLSAEADEKLLGQLEQVLRGIHKREAMEENSPRFARTVPVLSVREAMLAEAELLPVTECVGRILAVPTVGCPPAVPILVCGERIDEQAVEGFRYYGIERCCVVKKKA